MTSQTRPEGGGSPRRTWQFELRGEATRRGLSGSYVEGCCRPRTKYGEVSWPGTRSQPPGSTIGERRDVMRPHAGRAIVAGFVATTAMTLALYVLVSVVAGQPLDSAMLG